MTVPGTETTTGAVCSKGLIGLPEFNEMWHWAPNNVPQMTTSERPSRLTSPNSAVVDAAKFSLSSMNVSSVIRAASADDAAPMTKFRTVKRSTTLMSFWPSRLTSRTRTERGLRPTTSEETTTVPPPRHQPGPRVPMRRYTRPTLSTKAKSVTPSPVTSPAAPYHA